MENGKVGTGGVVLPMQEKTEYQLASISPMHVRIM